MKPVSGSAGKFSGFRPWLLRLWRAGAMGLLALLTCRLARRLEPGPAAVTVEEARTLLAGAAVVAPADAEGVQAVFAADGTALGSVLRTAPRTDGITGYAGPHDLLIGLGPQGAVTGVRVLQSGDTPEHVELVLRDPEFLQAFCGWKPGLPFPEPAAVGGATLTSRSMAGSLQERLHGGAPPLRFPGEVTLEEVRALFPEAASLRRDHDRLEVRSRSGARLGFVLRTAPESDGVTGYRGPSESLVALALDGATLAGVRLRNSDDTGSYVQQIRDDTVYLNRFTGRTAAEVAALDFAKAGLEGVSGATQTSWAVAEGIKRRMARPAAPESPAWRLRSRDWMAAGVVAGAVVMAFTRLRGTGWLRAVWQALLMGWALGTGGDLVSLALLAGWAQHGVPWAAAPGAALIAGAALFLPWATRRQVYCHQICPHGAAQQWLGKLRRRRWTVPVRWDRWLVRLPWLLLAAAIPLLAGGFRLTLLEPFDAWVWRAAAAVPGLIALAGLAASLFVPQAYCRYGCPTGALLGFVRSAGGAGRPGRRDAAFALLLAAAAAAAGMVSLHQSPAARPDKFTVGGRAMGTTWQITLRGAAGIDPEALRTETAALLEEIENDLSNWRPASALSRSNAAGTTRPFPVSPRLAGLVRRAAGISEATRGAFDITAGRLVKLWGFGPPPHPAGPPSVPEITAALAHTGWRKVQAGEAELTRSDPLVEIDLTALTEGQAAAEIAARLTARGAADFLINVGGELLARGAWPVAVEHPLRPVLLRDETLATSGTYRQNREEDGRRVSHLIHAVTGRPAGHETVSVSVRHPDPVLADAWATALNILGREEGLPVAEQWGLAAEFVEEDARGRQTLTASGPWRQPGGPLRRARPDPHQ